MVAKLKQVGLFLLLFSLVLGGQKTGSLYGEPVFPSLSGRVVDEVGVITPGTKAQLNTLLSNYEATTSNQLVVVVLKSLNGYEIQDYGYQLGRHWKIGQKGVNNGILLIVAPNERSVTIQVGYGMEGVLTDVICKEIIEHAIIPQFRQNNLEGGILAGVNDIISLTKATNPEEVQANLKKYKKAASAKWDGRFFFLFFFLFFIAQFYKPLLVLPAGLAGVLGFLGVIPVVATVIVVFIAIIFLFGRVGRGGGGYYGGGFGGGGGSWGGGGGFGGGSFSGGGGSFGGGGASGGW